MNEAKQKIAKVQKFLHDHGLKGVRLRGVDWFSWITCGGNSVVIFTSEVGIAEALITEKNAYIITNNIERDRLAAEEIPPDFELVAFPWQETSAIDQFVKSKAPITKCLSDRPTQGEKPLPHEFLQLRLILTEDEVKRYRLLGEAAAEAMTEAINKAESDWTEHQLAAEGSKSLWARGLDPTLVLVGGERRVPLYRHPIATEDTLGGYAMMVFCARSCGLYANLTRFIFFREPHDEEVLHFQNVAKVESMAFAASRAGQKLSNVYGAIKKAYEQVGLPDQINKHHQGGLTGYLSREIVATPNLENDVTLANSMALAWNPSLPGAKIEDTVLIEKGGVEILTRDPLWPTFELNGLARPEIGMKK